MGRMCDLDIELRNSLVTLSKQEFIKKFGKEKYDEYWRKVLDEDTRIESERKSQ
jgi:hypothetical protein